MFLTVDTSITIRALPEAICDYACKPENWSASNLTEHFGLRYDSPDNLPHTGATFTQRESVAGIYAVMNGRQAVYDHIFRELRYFKGGSKLQQVTTSHDERGFKRFVNSLKYLKRNTPCKLKF